MKGVEGRGGGAPEAEVTLEIRKQGGLGLDKKGVAA